MSNFGCFCFGSVTLADDDEGPFFLLLSSLHSWASSFEWDSRCFRRPLVVPLGALYDLPQLLHCALFLSDSKSYRCPKGTTNPSEASSVSCLFQKNENTQKLLDKAIVQFLCNLYFMAKFWRQNMLKRFGFEGQDSITNPNPNIIRLEKNHESESEYSGFGGKDSNPNPNPNIRYNTDLFDNWQHRYGGVYFV